MLCSENIKAKGAETQGGKMHISYPQLLPRVGGTCHFPPTASLPCFCTVLALCISQFYTSLSFLPPPLARSVFFIASCHLPNAQ